MQESGEMYLETIGILTRESTKVRAIDIVNHMGFSKPSVSRALSLLKRDEYISVDESGYITLTERGSAIAEHVYDKHNTLFRLLVKLGVSEATAEADACRMEHVISEETFGAVKNFVEQAD